MSNVPPTGPSGGDPPPTRSPFSDEASPYASPHAPQSPPMHGHGGGDATGGMIPYKNPTALIGYYLGILGMLPCIGIVFSLPAFVLGIMGLRAKAKNPAVKGSVHAWIAIILGGIFTVLWTFGWIAVLAASLQER